MRDRPEETSGQWPQVKPTLKLGDASVLLAADVLRGHDVKLPSLNWEVKVGLKYVCKKCSRKAECEDDDECEGTNLCYQCFEDGVEDSEERRIRRIQEANEY